MIKIEHKDLVGIVNNYKNEITTIFSKKFKALEEVGSLLQAKKTITKKDIKNVKDYSSALQLLMNLDKLYSSKHPTSKGKDTADLIYSINKLKVNPAKKSKCRKTKNINTILATVGNLKSFLKNNDLFGGLPKDLITLNNDLEKTIGQISVKFYNHFFDYQKYYSAINNGIGKALDLKTCPYCNRNYITYIPDKQKRTIGPSYDHFFSKSNYKYITLSFYNLIPSCYVCNSNLKGAIPFELNYHTHPYLGGFGEDITFDFNLVTTDYLSKKKIVFEPFLIESKSMSINKKNRSFGDVSIKNSGNINVFKLQEVYKSHQDSVEEIYKRFEKNGPYYLGAIHDILDKLDSSEEEFYRYTFRNYFDEADFNNRPLAKLDKDIYLKMKNIAKT